MNCTAALLVALNALSSRPEGWDEHAPRIAEAIAASTRTPREAAIVFALGRYESNFLPRIQEGDCRCFVVRGQKQCECDWDRKKKVFAARGFWQLHPWVPEWENLLGLEPETIELGARVVSRMVRRGLRVCHTTEGAIGYFACGSCGWPGGAARARYAREVEARLGSCGRKS